MTKFIQSNGGASIGAQQSVSGVLKVTALGLAILSLSACSTLHKKSALSSSSVYGNSSSAMQSYMNTAPRSYTCWDGCEVLGQASCAPQRHTTHSQSTAHRQVVRMEVQCTDGSIVGDVAQCPRPRQVVQQAAIQRHICSNGIVVDDASQCGSTALNSYASNSYTSSGYVSSGASYGGSCGTGSMQDTIHYGHNQSSSSETGDMVGRITGLGQQCNVESVSITGHADTSGSYDYNMGLSRRRARNAKAALVRRGIAASRISTQGMGETQTVIDLGDGVRERANRRTDVQVLLTPHNNSYGY